MPLVVDVTPSHPYRDTRRTFTNNLVNVSIPDNANADWAHLARTHQGDISFAGRLTWQYRLQDLELLKALFDHPAMEPNREQTFMTPANKKTKVYFLWDFVGRTLGTLYSIPADVPDAVKNEEDGVWQDVMGRATYAELLITEPDNPISKMMMSINIDENADFGPEVTRLARSIKEKENQMYTRAGLREQLAQQPGGARSVAE